MRHSVPNLFQCQNNLPIYFLSQDYAAAAAAAENFIQPLASAPAAPPFIYPNMTSVFMPTAYPDMAYANAQFMSDFGPQNVFQYRPPFVQMPVLPQGAPMVSNLVAPNQPMDSGFVQRSEPSPIEQNPGREYSSEDELAGLFRRIFIDDRGRTLRDLTNNQNVVAQLNYNERRLVLRHQIRFYFSAENLAKDLYLRTHMDDQGFVSLGLLITFPRIKILALDYNTIIECLSTDSEHFELRLNDQDVKIRSKSLSHDLLTGTHLSNNSANALATPSATSPTDSSNSTNPTKRPSQPSAENISVDDVRRRLIQGRSKQSPASSEHSTSETPSEPSPPINEQDDQWTVYKKKNRQPRDPRMAIGPKQLSHP